MILLAAATVAGSNALLPSVMEVKAATHVFSCVSLPAASAVLHGYYLQYHASKDFVVQEALSSD